MKIMELIGYPEMILAAICFLFLHNQLKHKNLPINFPFIGMTHAIVLNLFNIHDCLTYYLSKNDCTGVFKGPWFTNMTNIVYTSDPANIRYIFNTNFSNYPKGPEFKEIFDILGDGIFNTDFDEWKSQRKVAQNLMNHKKYQSFLEETICDRVENGLIPVVEHVVMEQNMVVNLQELLKRLTFDITVILFTGIDPGCLSVNFDKLPFVDALDDADEAMFFRHAMPASFWKLQRFLGIGMEKKLAQAKVNLDQFIAQFISAKRKIMQQAGKEEIKGVDLLTSYMEDHHSDKFLRDTMINFLITGRGGVTATLTWFFWLLSKHPIVEQKLIQELAVLPQQGGNKKLKMFDVEELSKLVYLHATICEVLRLYPPVPLEHKIPHRPDILPSGHRVDAKTKILPSFYAMGRMEQVWGKDCLEFKPERWISEDGGRIKHVPSYKFTAFNSGPRICIGKETSFVQMRVIAATLLYNYHVDVVESHPVQPKLSIILYLKHGLKARIRRRF